MNGENRDTLTLGADVGGRDAHTDTNEHVQALRKLFRNECKGPYSSQIREFALVLRIDGEVQSWGKRGVDNVRLHNKIASMTADIFVPRSAWAVADRMDFRRFLATEVIAAIHRIAEHAKARNIVVSSEKLSADIGAAMEKFLD